jgi:hypothetical protein
MDNVSLTYFLEFVLEAGTPKLGTLLAAEGASPATMFASL